MWDIDFLWTVLRRSVRAPSDARGRKTLPESNAGWNKAPGKVRAGSYEPHGDSVQKSGCMAISGQAQILRL